MRAGNYTLIIYNNYRDIGNFTKSIFIKTINNIGGDNYLLPLAG